MKYKLQICKECDNKIAVPTIKGLCKYHYWKERAKISAEKNKGKKTVRKASGELSIFHEIFDERKRVCFVTGVNLDTRYFTRKNVFPHMFHHVLSKAAYPRFRFYKKNIVLLHPEVHHLVETKSLIDLTAFNSNYVKLINLKDELKSEYYGTL